MIWQLSQVETKTVMLSHYKWLSMPVLVLAWLPDQCKTCRRCWQQQGNSMPVNGPLAMLHTDARLMAQSYAGWPTRGGRNTLRIFQILHRSATHELTTNVIGIF